MPDKLIPKLVPAAALLWLGVLSGCTVIVHPLPPAEPVKAENNFLDFDAYEDEYDDAYEEQPDTADIEGAVRLSGGSAGVYLGFGGRANLSPAARPVVRRPNAGTPFEIPDAEDIPGRPASGNAGVPLQLGKRPGRVPPQLKSRPAREQAGPDRAYDRRTSRSARSRQERGGRAGRLMHPADRQNAGRAAGGNQGGNTGARRGAGKNSSKSFVREASGGSPAGGKAGRAASGSVPQARQVH